MRKFINDLEQLIDEIYTETVQTNIVEKCDEAFDIIEQMKEKDKEDNWDSQTPSQYRGDMEDWGSEDEMKIGRRGMGG